MIAQYPHFLFCHGFSPSASQFCFPPQKIYKTRSATGNLIFNHQKYSGKNAKTPNLNSNFNIEQAFFHIRKDYLSFYQNSAKINRCQKNSVINKTWKTCAVSVLSKVGSHVFFPLGLEGNRNLWRKIGVMAQGLRFLAAKRRD